MMPLLAAASTALLQNALVVGAILFALGLVGILARRNLIVMFLSAELMLQGISVSLVAWSRHHGDFGGQVEIGALAHDRMPWRETESASRVHKERAMRRSQSAPAPPSRVSLPASPAKASACSMRRHSASTPRTRRCRIIQTCGPPTVRRPEASRGDARPASVGVLATALADAPVGARERRRRQRPQRGASPSR